mmetsp:Transcript_15364/g.43744  ORF Transcript_15364/g.43744 Transcript_15364/m.43744 type:complete len:230 (+) Transcript_15364:447-1136(+)
MASSKSQGRFDVASVSTEAPVVMPSIWVRSSVFKRLDASCSLAAPRRLANASISSKNTTAGARARAQPYTAFATFSLSPTNFESRLEGLTLKKAARACAATALANKVLPVPGGPNSSTPRQGVRTPVKKPGMSIGRTAASVSNCFVASSPPTSSHRVVSSFSNISSSTRREKGSVGFGFGSAGARGLRFSGGAARASLASPLESGRLRVLLRLGVASAGNMPSCARRPR